MKKVLYLLSLLSISCLASAQSITKLVEAADPAVFKIMTYDAAGLPLGTGTGFFVGGDGRALTNWHVLEDCTYAVAMNQEKEVFDITAIFRASVDYDLAEFQVEIPSEKRLTVLPLNVGQMAKGSDVFVIGCPEGYMNFVSRGLISAYYEEDGIAYYQSEASISSGSSGSPVLSMNGEVCAVVTASDDSGQNLNFFMPIEFQNELSIDFPKSALTGLHSDHYVYHQRSAEAPNLMLHSIECTAEKTTVHMSFSNTSLLYGDGAFIFTDVDDPEQCFHLIDTETGEKHRILSTNIGTSPTDPTYLMLGETAFFELVFPPIKRNRTYDLTEGMSGGDWSFSSIPVTAASRGVKLNTYRDINELETLWQLLLTKEDIESMGVEFQFAHLDYRLSGRELSAFEMNLAGVISSLYGNDGTAYDYFMEAVNTSPLYDSPWINLYVLNPEDNDELDLQYVNNALRSAPDSPEYHHLRSEVHWNMGNYAEAAEDLGYFLESDRTASYEDYIRMGLCQMAIYQTEEGCLNSLTGLIMLADGEEYNEEYATTIVNLMRKECDKKFLKEYGIE